MWSHLAALGGTTNIIKLLIAFVKLAPLAATRIELLHELSAFIATPPLGKERSLMLVIQATLIVRIDATDVVIMIRSDIGGVPHVPTRLIVWIPEAKILNAAIPKLSAT